MVAKSSTMNRIAKEIKADLMAEAVAIISRDGVMISAELPHSVHEETFAIMNATILGAALTANSELGKNMPDQIMIRSSDGCTVVAGAGNDTVLVVTVPAYDPDLDTKVDEAVKKVIAYK